MSGANGNGNGAGDKAVAPLSRTNSASTASTSYSRAESVDSNRFNINLTQFEEILSYIEFYTEKSEEGENSFFNVKVSNSSKPDIAKITNALSDEALTIFEQYEDRKINTAIGYIKEVRDKLSGGKVLKHLKYIRKTLDYILYRALPDFIKPPPKDEDDGGGASAGAGAESKGGYRKRRSKKVKRSRRRLTHRR
jgi:hypothetical protein